MKHIISRCKAVEVAALLAGLLLWPAIGAAQDVSGQARAVQADVLGAVTTVLADTGTLSGPDDAREASLLTGSIPSLGSAGVLHATTISSVWGWDALDSVASEASVGSLNLGVGANAVSADFVMARALTPVSGASSGSSDIAGLLINGVPVAVTGEPNQTIALIGGRVVINEQLASATGIVVNALHIIVDSVADVVIASASSGIAPSASSAPATSSVLGSISLF